MVMVEHVAALPYHPRSRESAPKCRPQRPYGTAGSQIKGSRIEHDEATRANAETRHKPATTYLGYPTCQEQPSKLQWEPLTTPNSQSPTAGSLSSPGRRRSAACAVEQNQLVVVKRTSRRRSTKSTAATPGRRRATGARAAESTIDVQTRKQLTLRNTVLPPSPHARSRPLHAPTFGIGSPSPGEGGV